MRSPGVAAMVAWVGGFAALHYWFPKMTGRTMGESLARISFWTMAFGILLAFVPLFLAGAEQGEVVDAYKFFDGTGVNAYNLIASIGAFVLATAYTWWRMRARERDSARQR
jgi:heme/copper-type cytochrome/quinol oxidase subunit 1